MTIRIPGFVQLTLHPSGAPAYFGVRHIAMVSDVSPPLGRFPDHAWLFIAGDPTPICVTETVDQVTALIEAATPQAVR